MGELTVLTFVGSGGVLVIAGLVSAYNAAQSGSSSLGLGVAAAGFSLSGALCYLAAAWLLTRAAATAAGRQRLAETGFTADRPRE